MTTLASAVIDTGLNRIIHRNFIIQEAYVPGQGNVWEWCHEDFSHESTPQHLQAAGTCQTLFDCIDAVENWHDNRAEADYLDHQQSLMESGGPNNSAYRREMVAAGRGHLLGDRS